MRPPGCPVPRYTRLAAWLLAAALVVPTGVIPPARAQEPPADKLPVRTLHDLLTEVEGRLVEVRKIDLRRTESEAELAHIQQSRAFEVDIEGNYHGEDLHREELHGGNLKAGHDEDIHRNLSFAITRPLLGLPLEQRIIVANEQQRLVELREAATLARREEILKLVGIYVDLAAEQNLEPLRVRAAELAAERVRMVEAKHANGESLLKDVLGAKAQLAHRNEDLAKSRLRTEELRADLNQLVDGVPPGPFRAAELDWSAMAPGNAATAPQDTTKAPPPKHEVSGLWYTLPEIDLTFSYTMQSRDRYFVDEIDSEDGHTPGVQLSVEFPLDAYRAGRSFARQAKARAERQRIAYQSLARQTSGLARQVELAHAAAAARLETTTAELALREEEHRISKLRAQDVGPKAAEEAVKAIDAELQVIDAKADLGKAQGELARRYFEHRLIAGEDPIQISMAISHLGENAATASAAGSSSPGVE
jgi:hypothetical protein